MIRWLDEPIEPDAGGKAVNLSRMVQAGLPVPRGFALRAHLVDALTGGGDAAARHALDHALRELSGARVAVRSSGLGEDAAGASFAGIHVSLLGVPAELDAVTEALLEVAASARSDVALAYRARRGLPAHTGIGAVVQPMIDARVSGVVFCRDPVTGAAHTVVEASYGLGEGVVSGLVTPDHFELERDGTVSRRRIADKDLAIVPAAEGTMEIAVDLPLRERPCLSDDELARLVELGGACERLFGAPQDIEFAFGDAGLVLLQSRPITR